MANLYRSERTGDLELFEVAPGPSSGWKLIGAVTGVGAGDREQLLQKQEQLAQRERRQHGQLLKTRNTLDELACKLDLLAEVAPYDPNNYIATAEKILAAKMRAEGRLPVPFDAPPQPQPGVKLTAAEAIELFERVQKMRRGEV